MKIVFIIFALLIVYAFIDNNILWVTKHKLKFHTLPDEFDGLKIVQLADLHKKVFSKNNKRLIRTVKKQKPDYIMLCGDMISRDTKNYAYIEHLLYELIQICPVFYSLGNHEIDMRQENKSKLLTIIRNTGVILLNNETFTINKEADFIKIAGISMFRQNYRIKKGVYKGLRGYSVRDLDNAIGAKQGFTILLAHNPLFFETYTKWNANLILSGHIHGGIVRIPFVCGILSPERRFFPRYSSGIYNSSSSVLSVSRGLGKLRLFNPPDVVVLTLKIYS